MTRLDSHIDRQISEGTLLLDLTEVPNSDTMPRLAEKVAEINERRLGHGLPAIRWTYRYIEEDTAFLDVVTVCSCGEDIEEEGELKCVACRSKEMLEAPFVSFDLFRRYLEGEPLS